jgi:hypothetical protein
MELPSGKSNAENIEESAIKKHFLSEILGSHSSLTISQGALRARPPV